MSPQSFSSQLPFSASEQVLAASSSCFVPLHLLTSEDACKVQPLKTDGSPVHCDGETEVPANVKENTVQGLECQVNTSESLGCQVNTLEDLECQVSSDKPEVACTNSIKPEDGALDHDTDPDVVHRDGSEEMINRVRTELENKCQQNSREVERLEEQLRRSPRQEKFSPLQGSALREANTFAADEPSLSGTVEVNDDNGTTKKPFQCGDIVELGSALEAKLRKRSAIVTEVHEKHSTCVVLDDELQHGSEECWPFFGDVTLKSSAFRLGSRVVVCGMQSSRLRCANGKVGTVTLHPKEGHPCFLCKKGGDPVLTVCVHLDGDAVVSSSLKGKTNKVLVEIKNLVSHEDYLKKVEDDLNTISQIVHSS